MAPRGCLFRNVAGESYGPAAADGFESVRGDPDVVAVVVGNIGESELNYLRKVVVPLCIAQVAPHAESLYAVESAGCHVGTPHAPEYVDEH